MAAKSRKVPVHFFGKKGKRAGSDDTQTAPSAVPEPSYTDAPLDSPTEPHRLPSEDTPVIGPPKSSRKKSRDRIPVAKAKKPPSRTLSRSRLAELSRVAHRLFKQKRYNDVMRLFDGLVAARVQDPFPYTMLGTVHLAQKQMDKALALFEAAIEIDPHDVPARVYRGEIRLKRGQLRGAVDDFSHAIRGGLAEDPFVDRAKKLLKLAKEAHRSQKK